MLAGSFSRFRPFTLPRWLLTLEMSKLSALYITLRLWLSSFIINLWKSQRISRLTVMLETLQGSLADSRIDSCEYISPFDFLAIKTSMNAWKTFKVHFSRIPRGRKTGEKAHSMLKKTGQRKPGIILTFWAEYSDWIKWAFRISKRSPNDLKLVSL